MRDVGLIKSDGVYYQGVFDDIKKSKDFLCPVYEAFTNSLESIKLTAFCRDNAYINISIYVQTSIDETSYIFDQIVIEDNAQGFDDSNFNRMKTYKDNRKGFSNKGSGRIQLLHFFDVCEYESCFEKDGGFLQRKFVLSKNYLRENAIISNHELTKVDIEERKTVLRLKGLQGKKEREFYSSLNAAILKDRIISKYIIEFCNYRDRIPEMKISFFVDGESDDEVLISNEDIPQVDKEDMLYLDYYRLSIDGRSLEKTGRNEELKLTAFKINDCELDKNEIKLTSKGQVVERVKIDLECLSPKDKIDGVRYLFLLSGDYIDARDGDTRGSLSIPSREDFKKDASETQSLFGDEEIFIEDIIDAANANILTLYDEIRLSQEVKKKDIDKLSEMFLLNKETVQSISIHIDEPEEKILEKVYAADSKILAKKDAKIKKYIDKLDNLDSSAKNYRREFDSLTSDLVRTIPLQNRVALTHYVARRKLVLELFEKILNKELDAQQNSSRCFDEKLLHNLIFQQSTDCPEDSDLWVINEDFIYFKGTSEQRLCDVELEGVKLFKDEMSREEEEYLNSLGKNRSIVRPDVLVFPDEGKCIIIEFKNIDVNVS